jgi:hypothetical protein
MQLAKVQSLADATQSENSELKVLSKNNNNINNNSISVAIDIIKTKTWRS